MSASMPCATGAVSAVVEGRVVEDPFQERVQQPAEPRAGREPELARSGRRRRCERGAIERRLGRELGVEAGTEREQRGVVRRRGRSRCRPPAAARTARRCGAADPLEEAPHRRVARAGSAVNMWCRMRWATSSAAARGKRSRRSIVAARSAPDRVVVVEVPVGKRRGLADVVEERRQPDDRATPAPRRRSAACGPRGPRRRSCSAGCRAAPRARGRSPRAARSPRPAGARSTAPGPRAAARAPPRSARRRDARRGRVRAHRREGAGSTVSPSVAASRTARTMRSASSRNRVLRVADGPQDPRVEVVEPAERVEQRRVSRRPGRVPRRCALTVKSRRARSAVMSSPNSTRCGRRKSAYSCSRPERGHLEHVVAASDRHGPERGSRRWRRGTARASGRGGRRWRGPSRGARGRGARRASEPPTTYAAWPAAWSRRAGGGPGARRRRCGTREPRRASASGAAAAPTGASSGRGRGSSARPRSGRPRGTA